MNKEEISSILDMFNIDHDFYFVSDKVYQEMVISVMAYFGMTRLPLVPRDKNEFVEIVYSFVNGVDYRRCLKYILEYGVTEYVVCAALRRWDGMMICSPRHFDLICIRMIEVSGGKQNWLKCEQGFVNQYGDFLTRKNALVLARKNNQIRRGIADNKLYSENLY